jgi:hypothetical protein
MLTISEMMRCSTYEERLVYLSLDAASSQMTFESLRELNQAFYNSPLWKQIRRGVIVRDFGCDLAVPGKDILGKAMVHHMNPLKPKDLLQLSERATNPEFLVTVSEWAHNAIHYNADLPQPITIEREPGDTDLWRRHDINY